MVGPGNVVTMKQCMAARVPPDGVVVESPAKFVSRIVVPAKNEKDGPGEATPGIRHALLEGPVASSRVRVTRTERQAQVSPQT